MCRYIRFGRANRRGSSIVSSYFQSLDPTYSRQLLDAAADLFFAGERSRAIYTHGLIYPCADADQQLNMAFEEPNEEVGLPVCLPADELFKGAMVAIFNSTSYLDDLAWSALWLYRATKNETYFEHALSYILAPVCSGACSRTTT